MDLLNASLAEWSGALLLFLVSAVALLAGVVILQSRRLAAFNRRWQEMLGKASGGTIEKMLVEQRLERQAVATSVEMLEKRTAGLERRMSNCVRFVGMVRYDAFEDVTAQQSWSLAVYDESGDGAVVTCLTGREGCRVYSKMLEAGKSDRALTREEDAAIRAAVQGGNIAAVGASKRNGP